MPRKENNIPKGDFCYELSSGPMIDEDGVAHFKGTACPYYKHCKGIEGHCSKLKETIYDQMKICGINEKKYEE